MFSVGLGSSRCSASGGFVAVDIYLYSGTCMLTGNVVTNLSRGCLFIAPEEFTSNDF